jgi:hypothetical protein
MELTTDQVNSLKQKGLSDSQISLMAKQKGYTLPVTKPSNVLSVNQVSQLKSKGLNDSQISQLAQSKGFELPKVPGFVQGTVQDIVRPFAKLGVTTLGAVGSALDIGKSLFQKVSGQDEQALQTLKDNADLVARRKAEGYDLGYFGNVKPIQTAKEAIGVGAEIGSFAVGGSGASSALGAGLGGAIKQGAITGLTTGASSGGLVSFGQAIQDAENKPSDVAYKTLFGTAIGGAGGAVLGSITPIVVKGANYSKRFTDIKQINQELQNLNTTVFKPTPKQAEKWSVQGKDPIKTFTEIFGTDIPKVGKDNRFTKETIDDFVQRVDEVYKPASEGFNTILRNSSEVNSLNTAKQQAIKNLDAYPLTPKMKENAIVKIENEFDSILNEAKTSGKLFGNDNIPVSYTDNLKDRFWGATRNFGTEDATVSNAVNSSIGHGFKDSIESVIKDLNVKNYNKQLGDLIVLRDFLETKVGSLAGTGGKMTRLFGRIAGTVVGSQGGPGTAILGNLTGDKIAQIMINPELQPYRWIINKKLSQLPKAEILRLEQEANKVLKLMGEKRMQTLALPSPSFSTGGNPIPSTINIGGATTFEAPATKITTTPYNPPLKKSLKRPPTTKPTKIIKSKPIPK